MRPYGEATATGITRQTRQEGRWEICPGGFYKTTLSEWKRIKRQPKKRARREGRTEVNQALGENHEEAQKA